jgi:hypothetical protein
VFQKDKGQKVRARYVLSSLPCLSKSLTCSLPESPLSRWLPPDGEPQQEPLSFHFGPRGKGPEILVERAQNGLCKSVFTAFS